jgi:hypothetical protein
MNRVDDFKQNYQAFNTLSFKIHGYPDDCGGYVQAIQVSNNGRVVVSAGSAWDDGNYYDDSFYDSDDFNNSRFQVDVYDSDGNQLKCKFALGSNLHGGDLDYQMVGSVLVDYQDGDKNIWHLVK